MITRKQLLGFWFVRTARRLALAGIAVATLSIVMSGCNRTHISEESLSNIKSIEIDTDVLIPDEPVVHGAVDVGQFLVIGLLSGSSPRPSNIGSSFRGYMRANGIKVDQIVLRTFRRQLIEQGRFEIRKGGDATLKLEIGTYGFEMPTFYVGNQRKVRLMMSASLMSKDSTVMWKQTEATIFYPNLTTEYSILALLAKPQIVESSLEEASCILAYIMLSKLHPMPLPPVVSSAESRGVSSGESPEVLVRIPACEVPVVEPSWAPSERRIECVPGVGCKLE